MPDMTDDELQAMLDAQPPISQPIPPVVEVPRPDIAPPAKKRRGRAPLPRDKHGNIIRNPEEQAAIKLKTELGKRLPVGAEMMTDANVGKALAGAFATIGVFRGPHWRLFQSEETELGAIFGPLARLAGADAAAQLAKWITMLMAIPVVTAVVMPRVAVERQVLSGDLPREQGRVLLLQLKALMEAEKSLNINKGVQEAQALQEAQANAAAFQRNLVQKATEAAGEMHDAETKAEGIIQ